ncbi:MAG TPA: CBS domain-containing protein [Saliniramus sp.]|nr:CBS domain-containing protein [Saliniramus sp.]
MTVQHILAEKGTGVVSIGPELSLADASRLLSEKKIGAVVVSGDGNTVDGILSERDIIRALAREGAAALDMKISRYMTADVVTCNKTADMDHLMQVMTHGKFRHIPVVEDDQLVGIVSIGDVVKRRLAEIENEHKALKDYIAAG